MNWGKVGMARTAALLAAALLCSAPAVSDAASRRPPDRRDRALEAQLLAHVQTLASDAFEGREPGTEGEAKTLQYLGTQWFQMGLVSGTNDPGHEWFEPVTVVERVPANSSAQFTRRGQRLYTPAGDVLVLTSGKRSFVRNVPVLFVGGKLDQVPSRNELAGRVALLLDSGIEGGARQNALLAAGASAVLTVLDGERTLESIAARRQRSGYALATEDIGGDLEGFITAATMDRMLRGSALSVAILQQAAARADFAPIMLDLAATLEATTRETTIRTHNLIGKIPGRRPETGAVLFVAHWDHFGTCAEPPAEDLICNGAIDNASGLASLTEIARRLVKGPPLDRDIYFLATTAEELGLLGAHAFAEDPPLPLNRIVAAFNIDSNALAPAGTPLAIVGRGMTKLDAQIAAVARQQKRKLVENDAANAYVRRQDGWALLQHDIPAVLVSSAYGDIGRMEAFFEGHYHRPSDDLKDGTLELGGAAEDVQFHVALARWFGDVKKVPPAK